MLFNSIDFAIFLLIVFILYWFITNKNLKLQNILLVVSSFIFYSWWDYRFLALLFSSAVINFTIGLMLRNQKKDFRRKLLLWFAVIYNLGLLGVFKYLNFFIESIVSSFVFFGKTISIGSLNIILPVGISFFTFQALGYIIDVYNRKYEPTNNIINFSAFISFFPLILAGPIERGDRLLPQFDNKRTFNYSQAVDGMRQILWGLFKKIVIADNCAVFTDNIFNNHIDYNGSTLFLAAVLFTIQIYADFSGYSDMAIGVSRLFGLNLTRNFNFPYFATSVADFWRRWHITLSSWLRDYLFTPLSTRLRNFGATGIVLSLMITFSFCGLWHGANYTFIVWGILQGFALVYDVISTKRRKMIRKRMKPAFYNFISWFITFIFIVFTWIFFRANNFDHAVSYLSEIFSVSFFSIPKFAGKLNALITISLAGIFILIEWFGRYEQYAISSLGLKWKRPLRYAMYYFLIAAIFWFFGEEREFIYFQF